MRAGQAPASVGAAFSSPIFDLPSFPLTENIGHRALVYVEEYGLASGMRAGDA